MYNNSKIVEGQKIGKLTVLHRTGKKGKHFPALWECQCECGRKIVRYAITLRKDRLHACDSCRSKITAKKYDNDSIKGTKYNSLYNSYNNMHARCENSLRPDYKWYGGEAKKVCDEWSRKDGYSNFKKWAIENGYKKGLTLDRIDFNGNYEPSNCRWVTMQEQRNNTRNNHFITYKGETHTITEWARIYDVSFSKLKYRVYKWEKIDVNNIFKDLTRR